MEESCVSDPSLPLFPSPFPFPAVSRWDTRPSGCLLQHELNCKMYSLESWFYDFSTIPFHFPHGSFAPLELRMHQRFRLDVLSCFLLSPELLNIPL